MLGKPKHESVLRGKFLKDFLEQMKRIQTGNLNQEDLERIAFQNRTPEYEIVWEDDSQTVPNISNFCQVCDYYRDEKICQGLKYHCDKFKNRFDNNPIEQAKPRKTKQTNENLIP